MAKLNYCLILCMLLMLSSSCADPSHSNHKTEPNSTSQTTESPSFKPGIGFESTENGGDASGNLPKSIEPGSKANQKPKRPGRPLAGDKGELWSADAGLVPYTYSLEDLKRLEQLSTAKDVQGIQLMMLAGKVEHVNSGTPCHVIDPGFFRYEVRLETGAAVWTATHFVVWPRKRNSEIPQEDDKAKQTNSRAVVSKLEAEASVRAEQAKTADDDKLFRKWTSADKKYTIEAKFIKYEKGIAFLEQRDGKISRVKITKLCKEDQQHCRDLVKSKVRIKKVKNW